MKMCLYCKQEMFPQERYIAAERKCDIMIYQNWNEHLFVKVTNNNNYHAHMHRQVEIFYVLDGAIEITISGQKKKIGKGNAFHRFSECRARNLYARTFVRCHDYF